MSACKLVTSTLTVKSVVAFALTVPLHSTTQPVFPHAYVAWQGPRASFGHQGAMQRNCVFSCSHQYQAQEAVCTVRHQPNELYLVLPVASERSLLVEMYQVRSAGCVGVLEVNFVQRITLVAVGSPLATPCSMWLDSLATGQSRVPSRSSHVPTSTSSETAQDACRPNTTVRPHVQPKHLLTCKKPCPAWQLVTAG